MRLKIIFSVFVLLLITTLTTYAQGGPGDPIPCDPDPIDGCPLDTWVIILVVAASVFAAVHLYRRKKSLDKSRGSI